MTFPRILRAGCVLISLVFAGWCDAGPVITSQPVGVTVWGGSQTSLTVAASGDSLLNYQWQVSKDGAASWSDIVADALHADVTTAVLTLRSVPLTAHHYRYRVRITDATAAIVSESVLLQVEYSELWGMGSNLNGQLGGGSLGYHPVLRQVSTGVAAVATGEGHTLFLRSDGTLWATGANNVGQLGDGTLINRSTPVLVASNVTKIAAAGSQSFFLKTDDTLWACGANDQGQLGAGAPVQVSTPVQIATAVTAVAAGGSHLLFIRTDGTLWAAGVNLYGQLGLGGTTAQRLPVQVAANVAMVAAGARHSFFIKTDGALMAMGDGQSGKLGTGTVTHSYGPTQVGTDMRTVAAGRDHSLWLKTDGTVWAVGSNNYGQLGTGGTSSAMNPVQVADNALAVRAGTVCSYVIKGDGSLLAFGSNGYGQLGDGTRENRLSPTQIATNVAAVEANSHLMLLKTDGSVWAAGLNYQGQFGDGTAAYASVPKLIAEQVTDYVVAGSVLYVKNDGSLWGMGSNAFGQLGDGSTVDRADPILIDTAVARVNGSGAHTLYVKQDGTLWGMGNNGAGQLGDGTQTSRLFPVQITTGVANVAASADGSSSYFLKTDGTLWGTGSNSSGQLGAGTGNPYLLSPVLMDNDVRAIAAGGSSVHLLKTNGSLWALGNNFYGQLGTGNTTTAYSPIQVATNVTAVSAGPSHGFYTTSDGILRGMGNNSYGQLGTGSTPASAPTPVVVSSEPVTAFAAGGQHTLLVKGDGNLWGSGYNLIGQLGDGTTINRSSPVLIDQGVVSAWAGPVNSLFLKRGFPYAPQIVVQPAGAHLAAHDALVLAVSARGFPTPTYQWRKNEVAIAGATAPRFIIPDATGQHAGNYDVVASNALGDVTSVTATVTVDAAQPPHITAAPLGTHQIVGGGHIMTVAVTGTAPFAYQWFRDGEALPGRTAATLTLANLQRTDAGSYTVTVTNEVTTVTSQAAVVHVENLPLVTSATASRLIGTPGQALRLEVAATSAYAPLSYQWKRNNRPIAGAQAAVYEKPAFDNADAGAYTLVITDAHGFVTRRTIFVLPRYTATGVQAWGENGRGQTNVPTGLTDVMAVAAGSAFSLAVKTDGTAVAWGGVPELYPYASAVADLQQVVQVSGAGDNAFVLTADGRVQCLNFRGETGLPPPADLTEVIAVAPGLALKSDGNLVAWGGNQIGMPEGLNDVVAVAAGSSHCLALKSDGTVVAWGSNIYQQATVPAGLSQVKAIAAGGNQSMALKENGTAVNWGGGSPNSYASPPELQNAKAIATGDGKHYAVQADGRMLAWYSTMNRASLPPLLSSVLAVAVGTEHVLAMTDLTPEVDPETPGPRITALSHRRQVVVPGQALELAVTATGTGEVTYQWYRNGRKIVGATTANFAMPAVAMSDGGFYWVDLTDAETTKRSPTVFVIVAPAVTEVRGWGRNSGGQLTVPAGLVRPVAVALGTRYALALKADGQLIAWGSDGNLPPRRIPTELNDAVAIAASARYALALRSNGRVVVWGEVSSTTTDLLAGLKNVVAITVGYEHGMALRNDGTVVSWGGNSYGILNSPAGLTNVVAISAGNYTSMALKADGTVSSWGTDYYGQVSFSQGLTGITSIAAGRSHGLVLKQDGTVKGGGDTSFNAATPPPDLPKVTNIAAGVYHSLAIKHDGTVATWGNYYGGESAPPPADLGDVFQVAGSDDELSCLALRDATPYVAPLIRGQPQSQTRNATQTAVFSVVVRGETPMTYQWRKDGEPMVGATGPSITLTNLTLADAGSYHVVATNHAGSVTSETATLTVMPAPIITNMGSARRVPIVGQPLSLEMAVIGTGTLHYQWTRNGYPIPGATDRIYTVPAITFQDAGYYLLEVTDDLGLRRSAPVFVLVRLARSQITTWGENSQGSTIPSDLNDAVAIATGPSHGLAIRADGSLAGWGTSSNYSPLPVASEGFVAVSIDSTMGSNMALKADGTIVHWKYGVSPVPSGLKDVVSVASGYSFNWALKSDGTVMAWSSATTLLAMPGSVQNVVSLVAGPNHALALKRDGTVMALGNYYWQPPIPANLTGVVALHTENDYSLALKSDSSLVFWGETWGGQDKPPAGLTGVKALTGGASHALALKRDGTVAGWGRNTAVATPPSSLGYVAAIAASHGVSVALHGAIAPTIVAQPGHQSVGRNRPATFTASASGSPAPTYQWQMRANGSAEWTDLAVGSIYSGVTTPMLGISAVTPALNQNRYRLVATNTEGSAISNEAVLTLRAPYADWQADKFTGNETADPVISGPTADPDGDGYVNLLEYALGLDPKAANGAGLPEASATEAEWIYTYDRPADRSDVDYEVQVSTNLTDWSATGVTHERVTTGGATEQWRARHPLSTANVFFRLKVTQTE